MKISSGLSEFTIPSHLKARQAEKVYVWPVYGEGKINKIHGVTRRMSNDITYAKPTPEDHVKLLGLKESREALYSSSGSFNSKHTTHVKPGSFFDAFA